MRFFRRRIAAVIKEMDEKTEQQTEQNLADMADMATTLSGLQDEMDLANTPAANKFKPWWLLAAIVVAATIGGAMFMGVRRLTEVDENSKAIAESCEVRNEVLTVINQKFSELNVLIAVSVRNVDPADPKARDFLAAFENLRKPIPLEPC